jgi:hypothetical protein
LSKREASPVIEKLDIKKILRDAHPKVGMEDMPWQDF